MKTNTLFILIVALFLSHVSSSQVIIGGGVGVSIDVNIPFPDIVITKRKPIPPAPPAPRPDIHTCNHVICGHHTPRPQVVHACTTCNHNYAFGTINNQNRPNGQYLYQVVNANINTVSNGQELVSFNLNNGELLELVIATANHNDYNYHYNSHVCRHRCGCSNNNMILSVQLNGREMPLRDGSLSLQPRHGGFHAVVNLHSLYEGDFNGTVNK